MYNAHPNVNTNPEPKEKVKLLGVVPKDSHQHRAGIIASKFSGAKAETFHGGFFEPEQTYNNL